MAVAMKKTEAEKREMEGKIANLAGKVTEQMKIIKELSDEIEKRKKAD